MFYFCFSSEAFGLLVTPVLNANYVLAPAEIIRVFQRPFSLGQRLACLPATWFRTESLHGSARCGRNKPHFATQALRTRMRGRWHSGESSANSASRLRPPCQKNDPRTPVRKKIGRRTFVQGRSNQMEENALAQVHFQTGLNPPIPTRPPQQVISTTKS